jgi:phosphatidylserine decarboxylase
MKLLFLNVVDLQEVALPLEEYPSLQAFFIRGLKEGARPVDPDPNCLVTGNKIVILYNH